MVDPCDYADDQSPWRSGGPPTTIVKPCVDDRHDTELACFSTASMASNLQVTHSGDDK